MNWRILAVAAALPLGACGGGAGQGAGAAPGAGGTPIAVENGDFESTDPYGAVPGWMTLQHAGVPSYEMKIEPAAAHAGAQGFRMTRTHEQVYGTLAQDIQFAQPLSGTVELSAWLKSKDVGPDGWALMVIAGGPPQYSKLLTGTGDWQHVSVRAALKPNSTSIRIGITLMDAGTGWADQVELRHFAP